MLSRPIGTGGPPRSTTSAGDTPNSRTNWRVERCDLIRLLALKVLQGPEQLVDRDGSRLGGWARRFPLAHPPIGIDAVVLPSEPPAELSRRCDADDRPRSGM